jgi:predicted metalloprotease with PDZ domain
MIRLILALLVTVNIYAQENTFYYQLDLSKKNDTYNVTVLVPQLSEEDNIYSFVSYAPGVHQPLDFGRFVKSFRVYDNDGNELITNKISINDFKILEPIKVSKIVYEIDDSFDMSTDYHPIYPMSGTGITDNYIIINTHGVFGYFKNLKNSPIELKLKLDGNPKVGTALDKNTEGTFLVDSYYHFTDSPILIGEELTYASSMVDEIKVEAFVYSPNDKINAEIVLELAGPILNAAKEFIGYSPVDRYVFLMYFNDHQDVKEMPVLKFGGALEHSYSSTYALQADPRFLPMLKNIIAHEFMHILSPLNLHSEILANTDYSKPVSQDDHVWLYEGVTEWVSYAMQVRSGIATFEDYLSYLSDKIVESEKFNSEYSLVRISQEWSTDEGNKQYGNIYQLGSLTAAMLDIKLLQLSNGETGLREVYLELIKTYGKNKPFDNATFFDEIVAATYPEIQSFIDDHVINNTPFNFKEEMSSIGISYYKQRKNAENLATLGIGIAGNSDGKGHINSLSSDYKGSLLEVGDIIKSINGIELVDSATYMTIMDGIKKMNVGEQYEIVIFRKQEEKTISETLYTKYDQHVFEIDPNATEEEQKLRKMWMTNN